MATSPHNAAKPKRARRSQRTPTFYPFSRRKGRRRIQDGFRVCWYEAGARKRAWVHTEKEARELVTAKMGAEVLAGSGLHQASTFLRAPQVKAAERAYQLLHDAQFTDLNDVNTADQLVAAIKWFVRNYAPPSQAPTVSAFAVAFLNSRSHRDKRTQDDYASSLRPFIEQFGARKIDSIPPADIAEFIAARQVSATTKHKSWAILHAFFNAACRKSPKFETVWLRENPLRQVLRVKAAAPRRVIYTADETKDLIQVAIYLGCAPIVVFRLFSCLRADEAKKFFADFEEVLPNSPNALKKLRRTESGAKRELWVRKKDFRKDLDLNAGIIRYHEETDATYTRTIPIVPALKQWLQVFQTRGITLCNSRLEEDARRIAVPRKFGPGYDNLIRHTAISQYAAHSRSLADTAYVAGTSEKIIREHYRDFVSQSECAAFYALTPDKFDLTMLVPDLTRTVHTLSAFADAYPGLRDFFERRANHNRGQAASLRRRNRFKHSGAGVKGDSTADGESTGSPTTISRIIRPVG